MLSGALNNYILANITSVYSISIKSQLTQLYIDIFGFKVAKLRAV